MTEIEVSLKKLKLDVLVWVPDCKRLVQKNVEFVLNLDS